MRTKTCLYLTLTFLIGFTFSAQAQDSADPSILDTADTEYNLSEEKENFLGVASPEILAPEEFHQKQNSDWETFSSQQQAKEKEFIKSLENMPVQARQTAVNEHRQQKFQAEIAYLQEMHGKYMDYLQKEFNKNATMTKSEKEDVIDFFEKQHEENIAFLRKQYRQNNDFYDDIAGEYHSVREQQGRIQEFLKKQKQQNIEHFADQKEQNVDKLTAFIMESLEREEDAIN